MAERQDGEGAVKAAPLTLVFTKNTQPAPVAAPARQKGDRLESLDALYANDWDEV